MSTNEKIHDFSVWLRTGSNSVDINRFRSHTWITVGLCFYFLKINLQFAAKCSRIKLRVIGDRTMNILSQNISPFLNRESGKYCVDKSVVVDQFNSYCLFPPLFYHFYMCFFVFYIISIFLFVLRIIAGAMYLRNKLIRIF